MKAEIMKVTIDSKSEAKKVNDNIALINAKLDMIVKKMMEDNHDE